MDLRYFKKSSLQCWFHWNTALHFVECNLGERPVIYLSEVFSNTDTECSHSSSREQQTWQRWRGQSSFLKIIFNKYLSFKLYFSYPVIQPISKFYWLWPVKYQIGKSKILSLKNSNIFQLLKHPVANTWLSWGIFSLLKW